MYPRRALACLAIAACSPAGLVSEGALESEGNQGCAEPKGPPIDPSSLAPCCPGSGGRAHCIHRAFVAGDMQPQLIDCDDGESLCVPDKFLAAGGNFTPSECTSIREAAGRCLSVCLPQVAASLDFLPRDVCDDDERCVPCVNPLTGESTGGCAVGCAGGPPADPVDPADLDDPGTCVHEGKPVVVPELLTPCGEGAHCLEPEFLDPAFLSQLAPCADGVAMCVPDLFLRTGGKFIPPTCSSVVGAEGRCLATVLPEVAAQEAILPQSTCGAGERCVPCFSPLDGVDTGACRLACDLGPTAPPTELPACCEGIGRCVPSGAVPPEDAAQLGPDVCPPDQDLLCAPEIFIDGGFTPQPCDSWLIGFLFGDEYGAGACLPRCLPAVADAPFLVKDECPDHFMCAPCLNPLSGDPSGACEAR